VSQELEGGFGRMEEMRTRFHAVGVMGHGCRVVGAVGEVMMTAWDCRDDEERKKKQARFKMQDPRL
jgi:hypothetical protein